MRPAEQITKKLPSTVRLLNRPGEGDGFARRTPLIVWFTCLECHQLKEKDHLDFIAA